MGWWVGAAGGLVQHGGSDDKKRFSYSHLVLMNYLHTWNPNDLYS